MKATENKTEKKEINEPKKAKGSKKENETSAKDAKKVKVTKK